MHHIIYIMDHTSCVTCGQYYRPCMVHMWPVVWTMYGPPMGPICFTFANHLWSMVWTICIDHELIIYGPYMVTYARDLRKVSSAQLRLLRRLCPRACAHLPVDVAWAVLATLPDLPEPPDLPDCQNTFCNLKV